MADSEGRSRRLSRVRRRRVPQRRILAFLAAALSRQPGNCGEPPAAPGAIVHTAAESAVWKLAGSRLSRFNTLMRELPRVVRRRSPISGWGVYAGQSIEEDTRIVEYKGALVPQAEAWRRELRYLPRQRIWIFTINTRWAHDAAVGGNVARYINHACRPNCCVDIDGHHIWIRPRAPSARVRSSPTITTPTAWPGFLAGAVPAAVGRFDVVGSRVEHHVSTTRVPRPGRCVGNRFARISRESGTAGRDPEERCTD